MSRVIGILRAGRAAIADSGNAGLNAVTITRVAIGSGLNPDGDDDDARAALRIQRDAAPAVGVPAAGGDIAVRADISPTAEYTVSEVGVFARTGTAGAEFLFGYWAAGSSAEALAAATPGGATIVVATVVRVAGSPAAVTVAPAMNLTISAVDAAQLAHAGDIKLSAARAVPAGWLACDGSAVSRAAHAGLYAAIGVAYGAGDGATTFNLPDFRNRVPVGVSSTRSRGGAETHTLTTGEMPAHTHAAGTLAADSAGGHAHAAGTLAADSAGAHTHTSPTYVYQSGGPSRPVLSGSSNNSVQQTTGSAGAHGHDISGSTATGGAHAHDISGATAGVGGGGAHANMQPFAVARFIIKT